MKPIFYPISTVLIGCHSCKGVLFYNNIMEHIQSSHKSLFEVAINKTEEQSQSKTNDQKMKNNKDNKQVKDLNKIFNEFWGIQTPA